VLLIVYGAGRRRIGGEALRRRLRPRRHARLLYVGYVIVLAKLRPHLMPPLAAERAARSARRPLRKAGAAPRNALAGLWHAL
jgi:TRAP-type mannitol/chloroaromatic compound transport system permease large subunit